MKDESVSQAIRNGDERVIHEVITKHAKLLWHIAQAVLHTVGSEQDVEECVADAFIYLWENPEKYDPRRGSLKTWLSIVVRSKATDRCRALSRTSTLSLEDEIRTAQAGPLDGLLAQDTRQELQDAVCTLEEPDRQIFIRRYGYEQKPREIALALGISAKEVNNRLYRAKRKLRDLLTHCSKEVYP